jgi:spore coat polysaccharide biosynthesis protein SpsF
MDVSIFSFQALERAWQVATLPSEREHVTFHFWRNPGTFKCKRVEHFPDWSQYRLTIDYAEDFEVLKAIIENFHHDGHDYLRLLSMEEIITFLKDRPDLVSLNGKFTRGLGWSTALQKDLGHL